VLVNRGAGSDGNGATGGEVTAFHKAIQTSDADVFIRLEPEPVVV
jgi:UDP-N-acetylmuramate dehydrogenase